MDYIGGQGVLSGFETKSVKACDALFLQRYKNLLSSFIYGCTLVDGLAACKSQINDWLARGNITTIDADELRGYVFSLVDLIFFDFNK